MKAWHRHPPKSISFLLQLRHGSIIQSSPRKAFIAGESRQISRRPPSRTDSKSKPGIMAAAWHGMTWPVGLMHM